VRYLGAFLDDPIDMPVRVLGYLVEQLQIRKPARGGGSVPTTVLEGGTSMVWGTAIAVLTYVAWL
jgi:hypothetical protein